MSVLTTIIPPASTPLERALDQVAGHRLGQLPAVVADLWNAATCPAALLPYLAWSVAVDEWDGLWSEEKKRAVIAEAAEVNRTKGTIGAIRRALAALGQANAVVVERGDFIRCDGSVMADGIHSCGGRWATYAVYLSDPVTVGEAYAIKRLLDAVGRASAELLYIDFAAAAIRCDGTITCDGSYSCGTVNTTIN
jgi:phage tail P2-like protein